MPKQCGSGMISIGGILGSNDVSENRGGSPFTIGFPIKNDQFGMSLAPFQCPKCTAHDAEPYVDPSLWSKSG